MYVSCFFQREPIILQRFVHVLRTIFNPSLLNWSLLILTVAQYVLCSRYYDVSCASSVYDMRVPCTWLIYTSILGDFHSSHRPWPLFAITGTKHYILLETWCCLVIYNTAKTGLGEPFFRRPPITRRWDGMGLHRCTQKATSSDVFNYFHLCKSERGETHAVSFQSYWILLNCVQWVFSLQWSWYPTTEK